MIRSEFRWPVFRHFPAAVLVLLLVGLVASGCGRIEAAHPRVDPDLVVAVTTEPRQPSVGAGKVLVTLADRRGQAIKGAHVRIECDMAMPGMVPVVANAAEDAVQSGHYAASVTWSMGGDWVVDVKVDLPDGRTTEQQFPARVGG